VNRRRFLGGSLSTPVLATTGGRGATCSAHTGSSRVRPGDPAWPAHSSWSSLQRRLSGRLFPLRSPLGSCRDPESAACRELFRELKNPYYIGDDPALTQTTGWVDAWTSRPSAYAVEARRAADVAAAIDFARDHSLRLVVKGGGHSYLGTSNAPDSLLIWTRAMNDIRLHDAFVARGCSDEPAPAVSMGAGAIWVRAYDEVTTRGGRYVQGGGCATVGVAGLVQGGGFGSFSKAFGVAAASMLEAEVVTADGLARTVNSRSHPDLFWALKGGGGGTFGVITRLTLATHELPPYLGVVSIPIRASDDAAFSRLVSRFLDFYVTALFNPSWGEIANIATDNTLEIEMAFQGFDQARAAAIWQPFLQWVEASPEAFTLVRPPLIRAVPGNRRWDPAFLKTYAPAAALSDDRPGASPNNIFWAANRSEAGHFIHAFKSAWLPAALLEEHRRGNLTEALIGASRHAKVEIHFQKGLAGGRPEAIAQALQTPMNPAVADAFALAIIGSEGPPAWPGLPGHEPDLAAARRDAVAVTKAMSELKKVAPGSGSYVAESDFFEPDWQTSYWGANYPKLLAIKRRYDPTGLFFAHHGVGSEAWSDDGFTRTLRQEAGGG